MSTAIQMIGMCLLIAFLPMLEFGLAWAYSYPFWLIFAGLVYILWPRNNE